VTQRTKNTACKFPYCDGDVVQATRRDANKRQLDLNIVLSNYIKHRLDEED